METTRQLGNYRVTKSETEFYCVHKPSLKRLISFCTFSMIWTIACIALCFGAYQEGASFPLKFFAIFFGIFECVILYSLLHAFFGKETLALNTEGFQYHRSLFCFCKETAVPLVEIERIIGDCEFGDSEDGVDGYLCVRSSFGQSITLVEHIPHHGLREMLDLIRETYERIRPNDSRTDEIFTFIEPKEQ